MTDLEKAKQWLLAVRVDTFGGMPVKELINGADDGRVNFKVSDLAFLLVAYASHSNSELLERVQKLEQALGLCVTELERHRADGYKGWREAHDTAVELLPKAPDTRNV